MEDHVVIAMVGFEDDVIAVNVVVVVFVLLVPAKLGSRIASAEVPAPKVEDHVVVTATVVWEAVVVTATVVAAAVRVEDQVALTVSDFGVVVATSVVVMVIMLLAAVVFGNCGASISAPAPEVGDQDVVNMIVLEVAVLAPSVAIMVVVVENDVGGFVAVTVVVVGVVFVMAVASWN